MLNFLQPTWMLTVKNDVLLCDDRHLSCSLSLSKRVVRTTCIDAYIMNSNILDGESHVTKVEKCRNSWTWKSANCYWLANGILLYLHEKITYHQMENSYTQQFHDHWILSNISLKHILSINSILPLLLSFNPSVSIHSSLHSPNLVQSVFHHSVDRKLVSYVDGHTHDTGQVLPPSLTHGHPKVVTLENVMYSSFPSVFVFYCPN